MFFSKSWLQSHLSKLFYITPKFNKVPKISHLNKISVTIQMPRRIQWLLWRNMIWLEKVIFDWCRNYDIFKLSAPPGPEQFCMCGSCQKMPSIKESVCCRSTQFNDGPGLFTLLIILQFLIITQKSVFVRTRWLTPFWRKKFWKSIKGYVKYIGGGKTILI